MAFRSGLPLLLLAANAFAAQGETATACDVNRDGKIDDGVGTGAAAGDLNNDGVVCVIECRW